MTTKKRQLLLHAYDEASSEEPLRAVMAEDEDQKEYEALRETRFLLERNRGRHKPRAAVLDGILNETRSQAKTAFVSPVPATPALQLMYRALAVAAVLVVGLAAGVFLLGGEEGSRQAPVAASEEALLQWETRDDIRALHQRLRTIQGASELSWDTPPVPLESLPAQNRTQGFIPANLN